MLLALFGEGGAAARVLTGVGVTEAGARAWLTETIRQVAAGQTGPPSGD